ncbi:MAG: hypothetical protein AB7F43_07285 [Bacteriovoracia bacterium]
MNNSKEKEAKMENENVTNLISVRLHPPTKDLIDRLLKEANDKAMGRKVKPDELIKLALGLVTDRHLQELKKSSLTNADRKKYLFQKYREKNVEASWDDFEGFTMTSDWPKFLKEHNGFEVAV